MYATFVTVHSLVRWAVMVIAVVGSLYALYGFISKPEWQPLGDQLSRWFNLLVGINVIIGSVIWVWRHTLVEFNAFYTVVHPLFMFGALILAGVMAGRRRRAEDDAGRWRALLLGTLIPTILILLAIPRWAFP